MSSLKRRKAYEGQAMDYIAYIIAVEEIAKLWAGEYAERKPLLTRLANDIEKKELLQLADNSLYRSKDVGKNSITVA